MFDLDDDAFSQELRLQADDGRWLIGLFVSRRTTDVLFEKTSVNQKRETDITTTTYAMFGQYSQPITTRDSVDLGIRAEQSRIEADMTYTTSTGPDNFSDEETFDRLLPKIAWNHTVENGILYLSVAKGYLSGGVNYNLATSADTLLYGAEESISYEAGFKRSFLDGRWRLTGALFYVDMKDKQVTQSVPSEMSTMKIDNAASAHTWGAELNIKARLTAGLDFFFSGGMTRSEVDDWSGSTYSTASGTYEDFDYAGNELPYVPVFTASAGLSYLHSSGLFARGDVTTTGSYYHDGANTLEEDALETVNLSLGFPTDHYTLTLWCKNLFDRQSLASATYWGIYPVVEDTAPRTVGIKLSYRF